MNISGTTPLGSWRRNSAGRWIVAVEAAALADFDGRAVVKVAKRRGGFDLVTVYKIGKPFHDTRTGTELLYAHTSSRQKVA